MQFARFNFIEIGKQGSEISSGRAEATIWLGIDKVEIKVERFEGKQAIGVE